MTSTVFDCSRVPGATCSLQLIGEHDDVLRAAMEHLASAHGFADDGALEQNVMRIVADQSLSQPYASWI